MGKDFSTAVENRRSIYGISKKSTISDDDLLELVNHAVKHCPSPFNSQNGRVVVLLGRHHDKLWDITKDILRQRTAPEKFAATENKLSSFQNGYGTILYFEDLSIVEQLQLRFPRYKDQFPVWSQHAIGMLQYIIWTALENEGMGASLQHYNPLIDDAVKQEWQLGASWKLVAQMPFGVPNLPPSEKQFLPLEERVFHFK